jgi:micrococcal nuclease
MRFFPAAALLFSAACAFAASPADRVPGPVDADVVSVYDGDTFTVDAHTWPGQWVRTAVRVGGDDTPEIKGKCDEERELAKRAKDFTAVFVAAGRVRLVDVRFDKYGGRAVADVLAADGRRLADGLIQAGLATPYGGGTKGSWCSKIK